MILILSGDGDPHAGAVEEELTRLGADFLRLDTSHYPDDLRISMEILDGGQVQGRLTGPQFSVPLDGITAAWVRRPAAPEPHSNSDSQVNSLVAADAAAVLDDLWATMEIRMLPAKPGVIVAAAHKGRQLVLASRLGFEIAPTLTGNDPDAFLDFVSTHQECITKRSAPGQRLRDAVGEDLVRLTEVVRPRDLVHADQVALCPITVQRCVPKALELRVTVVGNEVLTVAIHSQVTHHTRHDWRRYDHQHTPVTVYHLPQEVADRCRKLVHSLGLSYGTIDLIVTPDDRVVFLEVNPNGQYLWLETLTGLPISAAVARWLCRPSSNTSQQRKVLL